MSGDRYKEMKISRGRQIVCIERAGISDSSESQVLTVPSETKARKCDGTETECSRTCKHLCKHGRPSLVGKLVVLFPYYDPLLELWGAPAHARNAAANLPCASNSLCDLSSCDTGNQLDELLLSYGGSLEQQSL